jgi:AcrR family transcriptional regulator
MIDTKQKILDAAERLIAERGYSATSLRHIIAEAGVNLAAIHYHFGTKEDLLDELILRKAGPVNAERLAWLDRLEADAGGRPLPVEAILEAFLIPTAATADANPQFVRVMGRMIAEGRLPGIVQKHFSGVTMRIFGALRRALPELPDDEFQWRAQFMLGAMAYAIGGQPDIAFPGVRGGSYRDRIERLIAFAAGGFQAPVRQISSVEIRK